MGIQAPMAKGRSTKVILMIRWIRTSRLTIKNSLSFRHLLFAFEFQDFAVEHLGIGVCGLGLGVWGSRLGS